MRRRCPTCVSLVDGRVDGSRSNYYRIQGPTLIIEFSAEGSVGALGGSTDEEGDESEYHRSPHRGLKGTTPLETWLAKCHLIVPVDAAVDLAEAFRHEAAR